MLIPHDAISGEALAGLAQEFLLADAGFDFEGAAITDEKIAQVIQQIREEKILISFSEVTETAQLINAENWKRKVAAANTTAAQGGDRES